ncbi:hypothetical protein INT47_010558 [Mucor saturninus]|uniref:Iron-binding zinc finger CDGSH type domain-containing protein n=1 Tax=Mucor saturninus TaxID=64648 RepID=A0A8H7UYG7_9FUNG|nr:hypothetical protein INT47_010558 [Mucor saturninus]
MSSSTAEIKAPVATFVQPKPYKVDLEPGKDYYYCTCGESKNQPFCDGSHRAAGKFKPTKITVDEAKSYFLCGCKLTGNAQGFCDGTHRKEAGIKKYNEFLLKANHQLKMEKEQIQTDLAIQLAQAQRKQKMANVVAGLSALLLVAGVATKYHTLFCKK